jgi:hypothetical protein
VAGTLIVTAVVSASPQACGPSPLRCCLRTALPAVDAQHALPREDRPRGMAGVPRGLWIARAGTGLRVGLVTRFLINLGNALATLYLLYFLRDRSPTRRFPGQNAEDGC